MKVERALNPSKVSLPTGTMKLGCKMNPSLLKKDGLSSTPYECTTPRTPYTQSVASPDVKSVNQSSAIGDGPFYIFILEVFTTIA